MIQGCELTIRGHDGTSNAVQTNSAPALGKDYWGGSHKLCIDDFYKAIETREPFSLSPADIALTMALTFGCYESAATGKPVCLSHES